MSLFFTSDEVWTGGFYELALELGPTADDRLTSGLRAVWSLDMLDGCYLDRAREPSEHPRLEFEPSLLVHGHLQGLATLPIGERVACGTCHVRESDGPDWLVFYLPMSALDHAYPVGAFPFDRVDHEAWRVPLDSWLADIGRRVFDRVRFRLGLIGFEISGSYYAEELLASGVPEKRYLGFLVPGGAKLTYFPRTEAEA